MVCICLPGVYPPFFLRGGHGNELNPTTLVVVAAEPVVAWRSARNIGPLSPHDSVFESPEFVASDAGVRWPAKALERKKC